MLTYKNTPNKFISIDIKKVMFSCIEYERQWENTPVVANISTLATI